MGWGRGTALCLALVLAGCGGGGRARSTRTPMPSITPTATATAVPPSPTATPVPPTPTPSATPTHVLDLTVASLNILHGLSCPPASAYCRLQDRVQLFFDWVAAAGCPDVVNVQEVLGPVVLAAIENGAAHACPFAYEIVNFNVQNVILSRYPVLAADRALLHIGLRAVVHARIDHPLGPLDVFTTHLAAGVDFGSQPCREPCPAECVAAGAVTNRDCQAVQAAAYIATTHDLGTPAVFTGDFNAPPGSFVYRQFTDRGWIDSHLAAGNPECNPQTSAGCSCCRIDDDLLELEAPASETRTRIDLAFVIPSTDPTCALQLDTADDADGDGLATGLFAHDPNPFATTCGPLPEPICWPSDHDGTIVDVNCG